MPLKALYTVLPNVFRTLKSAQCNFLAIEGGWGMGVNILQGTLKM